MKPTLLVLAAGIGSRYGGLKQLDPVGPHGETIIEYSIYDALRAGFGKIVFVIREQFAREFHAKVSDRYQELLPIEHVNQELASYLPPSIEIPHDRKKPWGTGHAILVAEPAITTPFLTINADDFYGRESFNVMAQFLQAVAAQSQLVDEYAMIGFSLKNTLSEFGTVSRGICELDDDRLTGVTEFTRIIQQGQKIHYIDQLDEAYPLNGDEVVSMNMWGFTPSIFSHLKQQFRDFLTRGRVERSSTEFYIPTVVNIVIKERAASVQVLRTNAEWFGVTYKKDLVRAQEKMRSLIDAGVYPAKLWANAPVAA